MAERQDLIYKLDSSSGANAQIESLRQLCASLQQQLRSAQEASGPMGYVPATWCFIPRGAFSRNALDTNTPHGVCSRHCSRDTTHPPPAYPRARRTPS